jgi:hypothetical protein
MMMSEGEVGEGRRGCSVGADRESAEAAEPGIARSTTVGPHLGGLVAGGTQRVDQWQQMGAFVLVSGPEP